MFRHPCLMIAVAFPFAFSVAMQTAQAQNSNPAAKRYEAFAACQRHADKAVRVMRTAKEQMNHYLIFGKCVEKRGYSMGGQLKTSPSGPP